MNTGATMRVVEHHLVVLTKWWRSGLIFSTVSPLLFLAAMGVGLGTLVGDGGPAPSSQGSPTSSSSAPDCSRPP